MNRTAPRALTLILLACTLLAFSARVRAASVGDEFFEKEVRPLLIERCVKCHGGDKTRGSLKLTSREAVLLGGDTGPAAVPGKPDDSLLVQLVHRTDKMKMPKGNRLPDHEIAVLTRWVGISGRSSRSRSRPSRRLQMRVGRTRTWTVTSSRRWRARV